MISLILVFFYPSLSCQYAHIAQFQINQKCSEKWHESSVTKRKKTWLKLWASERNVSPSESELIKDFISIWWRPREKYFFFSPLSVLKAKYQVKAFKGHAKEKKNCFDGDTAILCCTKLLVMWWWCKQGQASWVFFCSKEWEGLCWLGAQLNKEFSTFSNFTIHFNFFLQ